MFLTILTGMVLFGVIHSLLAGKNIKDWARRRMGARAYEAFYRVGYNAVAAVTFAPGVALAMLYPGGVVWRVQVLPLSILLLVLQAAGAAGLLLALLQIDLARFIGWAQVHAYLGGRPLPLPDEPLQERGLYAHVRHPLYLFILLAIWPVQTMTESWLAFTLGATLYLVVGSRLEEKRLLRTYGARYEAYRRRVPWLIPRLKP